jgi:hypothetical protein
MIYVVVGEFMYTEIGNVLVTTNKEKAFKCTKDDFAGCTSLYVETWDNDKFIEDVKIA